MKSMAKARSKRRPKAPPEVGQTVRFLNVDLLIGGRFDRGPLARALGDELFALDEHAPIEGVDSMIIEVNSPGLDLSATLDRLIRWAKRLPAPARRAWAKATLRVFDIGIAAGRTPHQTTWVVPPRQVAAIARLRAEIRITVYGAEPRGRRRR
jgi:hypothetical protein